MKEMLPYCELWLLERAIDADGLWIPLWRIPETSHAREVGFREDLNCPLSGLELAELADLLSCLFSRGEIEFENHAHDQHVSLGPRRAAEVLTWLEDALEQRRIRLSEVDSQRCYRATSKGVARWERHALPDWNKYRGEFAGRLWDAGETTWSQSAATETFAREVLKVYSLDPFNPVVVHWETARIELHTPWEPMPGKKLPQGVTLSMQVTEYGPQGVPCQEWTAPIVREYHRQFRGICHWYENSTSNHPDRPKRSGNDAVGRRSS
jgi:hypothetical protein